MGEAKENPEANTSSCRYLNFHVENDKCWRGYVWRDWNPCALLVGMQNGLAAVENSGMGSQKIKHRVTI